MVLVARGVGKARFQQSATTHSRTGEKETLNINVVGKNGLNKLLDFSPRTATEVH